MDFTINRQKLKVSSLSSNFQSYYKNYVKSVNKTLRFRSSQESIENISINGMTLKFKDHSRINSFIQNNESSSIYNNNSNNNEDEIEYLNKPSLEKNKFYKETHPDSIVEEKIRNFIKIKEIQNDDRKKSNYISKEKIDYGDMKLMEKEKKNLNLIDIKKYHDQKVFMKNIYNSEALMDMKCIDLNIKIKKGKCEESKNSSKLLFQKKNIEEQNNNESLINNLKHISINESRKKIKFLSSNIKEIHKKDNKFKCNIPSANRKSTSKLKSINHITFDISNDENKDESNKYIFKRSSFLNPKLKNRSHQSQNNGFSYINYTDNIFKSNKRNEYEHNKIYFPYNVNHISLRKGNLKGSLSFSSSKDTTFIDVNKQMDRKKQVSLNDFAKEVVYLEKLFSKQIKIDSEIIKKDIKEGRKIGDKIKLAFSRIII